MTIECMTIFIGAWRELPREDPHALISFSLSNMKSIITWSFQTALQPLDFSISFEFHLPDF